LKIGKLALFIAPILDRDHNKDTSFYFYLSHQGSPLTLPRGNEQPRRKRRGIKRKLLNAPRGGELDLYPPQEDSSAAGGLKKSP